MKTNNSTYTIATDYIEGLLIADGNIAPLHEVFNKFSIVNQKMEHTSKCGVNISYPSLAYKINSSKRGKGRIYITSEYPEIYTACCSYLRSIGIHYELNLNVRISFKNRSQTLEHLSLANKKEISLSRHDIFAYNDDTYDLREFEFEFTDDDIENITITNESISDKLTYCHGIYYEDPALEGIEFDTAESYDVSFCESEIDAVVFTQDAINYIQEVIQWHKKLLKVNYTNLEEVLIEEEM